MILLLRDEKGKEVQIKKFDVEPVDGKWYKVQFYFRLGKDKSISVTSKKLIEQDYPALVKEGLIE